jgi:hypothetical protein
MNAQAADDLASMFKEGKVSGQVRAFYINREMINSNYSRDGLAIGGKLGYETATLNGLSAGAMFYTTNKIDGESSVTTHNDKTLFNSQDNGYTYLGQAYLNYKTGNTNIKVGRQELNTPMAGSDDVRMLPNTFEAAVLSNTDIKDTTLVAAHVTKIAYGSFANAYAGTDLALVSGYGAGYASYGNSYENGKYLSMSKAALGINTSARGVTAVAGIYKGIPNLTAQVWDYYAADILNVLYAQADYGWKCVLNPAIGMTASAQYIQENSIGDKLAGSVDAKYYGLQLAAKYGNTTLTGAYSATGHDTASPTHGEIISPWGGMPAFTQAMVTRHQFLADTSAYKFSLGHNFKELTGSNLTASIYDVRFNIGDQNGWKTYGWAARESGFDIIDNLESIKGLQLRFRGNFQRDSSSTADNRDEYRLIANYNF